MLKQLLLTHHNHQPMAIILENGRPSDIFVENSAKPSLVGNIYLGKVVRILFEQKMAFVNIGETRTALLHFNDCQKPPTQGEKLLVQVIKDPLGDKGARLTTKVRLSSRSFVYLPTEKPSINISKKINDFKTRERLMSEVQGKLKGGIIVRTQAQFCPDFEQELKSLEHIWTTIVQQKQANYAKKQPECLYQELPLFLQVVRDRADMGCQIVVEDDKTFKMIRDVFFDVNLVKNNRLYQDFLVSDLLKNALNPKIVLPSGGFLVIDEVEAMTVIDVNAGTSNQSIKTNFEAVEAIAHNLQLKNIGGIVVIDFIDMPKTTHRELIGRLNDALKNDPMTTKVYQFSALGLLEMTRERVRLSLKKSLETIKLE